jgi:ParB family transcriptional regulator, chromosome partitioning protein
MEMRIEQIHIGEIDIPAAQRALGDLDGLVSSIQELGLLHPPWVIRVGSRYWVIVGRLRTMAGKRLGWSEIPAFIFERDDLHAELATIDENLIRQELTMLERADQQLRRKEIHETLHPETRHSHGPRRGHQEKERNGFASFRPTPRRRQGAPHARFSRRCRLPPSSAMG